VPVNYKGNECCPQCRSDDHIGWGGFDGGYNNGEAHEHVECHKCGCNWDKVYAIVREEYPDGVIIREI